MLHPGVLFYGADNSTSEAILGLLDDSDRKVKGLFANHALVALAWIGNADVQSAFQRWQQKRPAWASELCIQPHQYTREAGWELTALGQRRDLYFPTAFPLNQPKGSTHPHAARIGQESHRRCRWCSRNLTTLFEIDDPSAFFPDGRNARLSVTTCTVCSCFGYVYGKLDADGSSVWHDCNQKPDYLPPDSADWLPFPSNPLVWTGTTRHFLAAANWLCHPGVPESQIGGIATWIQDAEYPPCPDCSRTMQFIGQVACEDFDEYSEGIYYGFLCSQCGVTATCYQQS